MRSSVYLVIDFNAYFASVEQQERPALRGRPVAVVPMAGTDTTCAIAASYEAKAFGVKTGMRIREALRLCPALVLVDARHDLYVDYHERLMQEVANHLPIHRVMSIDEAACRLIGAECEPENARAIARRMKAGIRANVGECLRCSIGIAPTILLAKIASNMQKPDGLTLLAADELPGPLLKLALTDLPGIAGNMSTHLVNAGIGSVADLWALTPKQARSAWRSVVGERFLYALHGVDLPDAESERRSIGHSRVLAPEMRMPPRARLVTRALLLKAAVRLRRYGYAAGGFGFSVRPLDARSFAEETRLPPTQDSFVLLAELERLWSRFLAERGSRARLLRTSVWLFRLVPIEARSPDLFVSRAANGLTRSEVLWRAVDKLGARYGRGAVALASQRDLSLQYLGAKIAFTRVPEATEFNE
jgi:DNA polymerase IV